MEALECAYSQGKFSCQKHDAGKLGRNNFRFLLRLHIRLELGKDVAYLSHQLSGASDAAGIYHHENGSSAYTIPATQKFISPL